MADDGNKKKMAVIGVSSVFLVAMVIAVTVGVSRNNGGSSGSSDSASASGSGTGISSSTKAVQALCQPTEYKQTCEDSLAGAKTNDPKELIRVGFEAAKNQISLALQNSTALQKLEKDPSAAKALEVCDDVLDLAIDDLVKSFDKLGEFDISKVDDYLDDIQTWLSGSVTYRVTCLDAFDNTSSSSKETMEKVLKTAAEINTNALTMVNQIENLLTTLNIPGITSRRLFSEGDSDFPSWIDAGKRRLLEAPVGEVTPDVTVAQDGSGKYKTLNEALENVPVRKDNRTYVIYVKAGTYSEHVKIGKKLTNIMMIGDGATKTRFTGNLNYIQGVKTINTATFTVVGAGFICKNVGFENTAGAIGEQAVALRVASDMSVFYQCQMDAYQDTLYAHTHRQFYRDCTITGTIDFIFGDGAAVFQNCMILIRKPMDDQQCIVTAQGRTEEGARSGFVLQNCTITGAPDYMAVKGQFTSYLGRPWKAYSRTLIMQSQIDDVIDPEGWMPWAGTTFENTCWFAEFKNRGPGAATTGRVTWPGIKKVHSANQAAPFTAGKFLTGNKWITATHVPYTSGMMNV
uniref:Pectinesterase n=1 Tax=Kalanchoe fedtschenkoi TaxID=63787 RepID=A0A7N0UD79_KALFE